MKVKKQRDLAIKEENRGGNKVNLRECSTQRETLVQTTNTTEASRIVLIMIFRREGYITRIPAAIATSTPLYSHDFIDCAAS